MDDRFRNIGEEVILTLLWQSGAFESATVSIFVISLSIRQIRHFACSVCVCVCERERERERERESEREREREGHITGESAFVRGLCKHIRASSLCLSRLCSPLGLELMVKLKTLLTVFIFTLKAEVRDYGKGHYISDECLWCSANHNALGQLANQSRLLLSEEGAW